MSSIPPSDAEFCSIFFFGEAIWLVPSGPEGILGEANLCVDPGVDDVELGHQILSALRMYRPVLDPDGVPPLFQTFGLNDWTVLEEELLFECEICIHGTKVHLTPYVERHGAGIREPAPQLMAEFEADPEQLGMNCRLAFFSYRRGSAV